MELRHRAVAAGAAALIAAACAGGDREAWQGTVDTLASGAIVVSNPATGIWDSASAWRIEEDLRIGSVAEGPASFSDVPAIGVDAAGRIYVIDRDAQEVRVFDARGRFVRTIGRKGGGPGEFVGANGLAFDRMERLWVVDERAARFTVFDTAGRFVTSHPSPLAGRWAYSWRGVLTTDGSIYDWWTRPSAEGERESVIIRLDANLRVADTFSVPTSGSAQVLRFTGSRIIMMLAPYAGGLRTALDARGYLWFARAQEYRVYQRALNGDTLRIIARSQEREPVTSEEEDSVIAEIDSRTGTTGQVSAADIPDQKPAIDGFWLDDAGYLWVAPWTGDAPPGMVLDVFDLDGRYLGQVRPPWPLGRYAIVWRDGRIYAVTQDEHGVPYVVRARIVRGGGR